MSWSEEPASTRPPCRSPGLSHQSLGANGVLVPGPNCAVDGSRDIDLTLQFSNSDVFLSNSSYQGAQSLMRDLQCTRNLAAWRLTNIKARCATNGKTPCKIIVNTRKTADIGILGAGLSCAMVKILAMTAGLAMFVMHEEDGGLRSTGAWTLKMWQQQWARENRWSINYFPTRMLERLIFFRISLSSSQLFLSKVLTIPNYEDCEGKVYKDSRLEMRARGTCGSATAVSVPPLIKVPSYIRGACGIRAGTICNVCGTCDVKVCEHSKCRVRERSMRNTQDSCETSVPECSTIGRIFRTPSNALLLGVLGVVCNMRGMWGEGAWQLWRWQERMGRSR